MKDFSYAGSRLPSSNTHMHCCHFTEPVDPSTVGCRRPRPLSLAVLPAHLCVVPALFAAVGLTWRGEGTWAKSLLPRRARTLPDTLLPFTASTVNPSEPKTHNKHGMCFGPQRGGVELWNRGKGSGYETITRVITGFTHYKRKFVFPIISHLTANAKLVVSNSF